MAKEVKGIIPALITPFTVDGKVDEQKLRKHVDYLVPKTHGLFICGSYGSAPMMSVEERRRVAQVVVEQVNGRVPVIVQVGTPDTASTVVLAKHAQEIGADVVAAVEPYYYIHTQDAIYKHYAAIIDAVTIPVYIYNNPRYSNFNVSTAQLVKLAEMGLMGIKDSSHNIALFYDFVGSVTKPGFTFLIGSQTHLLPAVVIGAHGCVSGLSNAFPELIVGIYDAAMRSDYATAATLQKKANALRKLTGEGIPIPFYHAVLPMRGVDLGYPRAPFTPLPEGRVAEIRQQLETMGMIELAGA